MEQRVTASMDVPAVERSGADSTWNTMFQINVPSAPSSGPQFPVPDMLDQNHASTASASSSALSTSGPINPTLLDVHPGTAGSDSSSDSKTVSFPDSTTVAGPEVSSKRTVEMLKVDAQTRPHSESMHKWLQNGSPGQKLSSLRKQLPGDDSVMSLFPQDVGRSDISLGQLEPGTFLSDGGSVAGQSSGLVRSSSAPDSPTPSRSLNLARSAPSSPRTRRLQLPAALHSVDIFPGLNLQQSTSMKPRASSPFERIGKPASTSSSSSPSPPAGGGGSVHGETADAPAAIAAAAANSAAAAAADADKKYHDSNSFSSTHRGTSPSGIPFFGTLGQHPIDQGTGAIPGMEPGETSASSNRAHSRDPYPTWKPPQTIFQEMQSGPSMHTGTHDGHQNYSPSYPGMQAPPTVYGNDWVQHQMFGAAQPSYIPPAYQQQGQYLQGQALHGLPTRSRSAPHRQGKGTSLSHQHQHPHQQHGIQSQQHYRQQMQDQQYHFQMQQQQQQQQYSVPFHAEGRQRQQRQQHHRPQQQHYVHAKHGGVPSHYGQSLQNDFPSNGSVCPPLHMGTNSRQSSGVHSHQKRHGGRDGSSQRSGRGTRGAGSDRSGRRGNHRGGGSSNGSGHGSRGGSGSHGRNKHGMSESGGGSPITLASIQTKVLKMSKDQPGCRRLQEAIDVLGIQALDVVLEELTQDDLQHIMIDPFGNYLFQKMVEVGSSFHRRRMLDAVKSQIVQAGVTTHGTRSVQTLVQRCTDPGLRATMIDCLSRAVEKLSVSSNGNHIVQRCLECYSGDDIQFVYETVTARLEDISKKRHGCCVVQRCIDKANRQQRDELFRRIVGFCLELMKDAYGNYVVQYMIQRAGDDLLDCIVEQTRGSIAELSRQKFASNVIEKCLELGSLGSKSLIIEEISSPADIGRLVKDQYANYVVQRALQEADDGQAAALADAIRPFTEDLKATSSGRRILHKLDKRMQRIQRMYMPE